MPNDYSGPRSSVIFAANIGSRDVSRDGQPVAKARPDGRAILDNWGAERARLDLPLLRPSLTYVTRLYGSVGRIILFASDQPESAGSHHETDTIHLAEIARRLLEAELPYSGKITVRRIPIVNPSLYDETYPLYRQEVANTRVFGEVETVCILASSGTQAMNFGLLVAAIERLGDRCEPLYLEKGAREPRPLNLGQQLRQSTLRRVAASHLDQYQFAAAREVLQHAGAPDSLVSLAAYASARINFDWDGAWRVANDALPRAETRDRSRFVRLRDEARALLDREDSSLFLGERFHRARIAHRTGAYSEFLTLMVGLQEAILQSMVLDAFGIDYRDDSRSARETRQRQIDERTGLRDFLLAQPTRTGRPLEYASPTRLVIRACLQYLLSAPAGNPEGLSLTPERKADLQELLAIEGRLEDTLAPLRNAAVHRDGGASRQKLDVAYNSPRGERADLLNDLERLTRLAGGRVDDWGIDEIRAVIGAELRR